MINILLKGFKFTSAYKKKKKKTQSKSRNERAGRIDKLWNLTTYLLKILTDFH